MLANRTRGALIVGALIILALALPAGAWAAESSQITSPANNTFLFVNEKGTVLVKGTSTSTKVDIRCYTNNENFGRTLIANVEVKGGAFEVEAESNQLETSLCQLRAVPHEAKLTELGPGQESANAKSFQGPVIITSAFLQTDPQDFFTAASTLAGTMFPESVGSYSFESNMFSSARHASTYVFYGVGALRAFPREKESTRASLQVDGVNAYAPSAARSVEFETLGEAKGLPGLPSVSVTKSFNESTHQFTVNEEEPIVKCAPENTYPPTKTSCTSFVSTGVRVVRSWQTTDESKLALLSDHFASIDGKEHAVDARYYMEMHSGIEEEEPGGLYQFPTQVAFGTTAKGDKETLPAGGLILYKTSQTTPDAGDGVNPQAAIAYDLAPSAPAEFARGTNEKGNQERNVSEIPYLRSVPAGGSSNTLRMAFAQGFALSEVKSMAEGALASYHPSVSISAPANGSSIVAASPTVTVSGNASDGVALTSLTLNGKAVAVGAGGAWSIPVTLALGSNTLTATAVNQAGLASSTSVTVSYALPAAKAAIVGSASGRNGKIRLTLACNGLPGQTCQVQVLGTTLERVRGRRIISISARTRTRSKRVTVASTTVKIAAGKRSTVVMGLNRTGRSLLGRFHSLPVRLTAALSVPGAARSTFLTRKVTVKPPPPKHRKHH